MTFEQAITALKQGKKVRRVKGVYFEKRDKNIWCINTLIDCEAPISSLHIDAVLADDWEICGEENQTDESGVSIGCLRCKVTASFDECERVRDIIISFD